MVQSRKNPLNSSFIRKNPNRNRILVVSLPLNKAFKVAFGRLLFQLFCCTATKKRIVVLKSIHKILAQAINTLIDITVCSRFSVPVRAIEIAKRQCLSLSRTRSLPIRDAKKYQIKEIPAKKKWNMKSCLTIKVGMYCCQFRSTT